MKFNIEKLIQKNRVDGVLPISEATRALNPHIDFNALGKNKRQQSHNPGEMNSTEKDYAEYLQFQKNIGVIKEYGFEAINLKLANKTHYRPDFFVIASNGSLEFHEVKGFWRDDARVKIKVAAQMFPHFRFKAITRSKNKTWNFEEFKSTQR